MNSFIKYLKEVKNTDRGRAIFFFVFFFFFFLFLGVYARANGAHPVEENTPDNYSHDVSIDELLDNNFSYVYTVVVDNKTYTINGKINENVEEFDFSDGNSTVKYYRSGENYYVNNNDVWEKGNVPLELSKFFKTKKLNTIIKKATYDSRTDYKSGKITYNLFVSTNTINKILDDKDTDFDEVPNEINISLKDGKVIEEVFLKLDSYGMNNNISKELNMTLEYANIGKVGVIENPLNK